MDSVALSVERERRTENVFHMHLKLRLIFIEFRNRFEITPNCPNIEQFNCFVGINIIARC